MWHRLQNIFSSIETYQALSPDLTVRQQVRCRLHQRPACNFEQWFETFYKSQGIAHPIAAFVYFHLEKYSGLPIDRLLPNDRLNEDLHWSEVCWFDWEANLCDDFLSSFGIDISDEMYDSIDDLDRLTIGELMTFLNQQWAQ